MITGIDRKNSRRLWHVPNFSVYGSASELRRDYLAVELVSGITSTYYGESSLRGIEQKVLFSSLTDHLHNSLPSSVKKPLVIVQPRGPYNAFVVGDVSDQEFTIARGELTPNVVLVDLIIIELGR